MAANRLDIKSARRERGYRLKDVAAITGCSVSHLSQIESGRRGASRETLELIARAYGMDVDELALPQRTITAVAPSVGDIPGQPPLVYDAIQASGRLNATKTANWLTERARSGEIPHTCMGRTIVFTERHLRELIEVGPQPPGTYRQPTRPSRKVRP